jgi:hypothetical protein
MTHYSQDKLVLLYYGELENHGDALAHLEMCAECRAEYERLRAMLAAVDSVPEPEWTRERAEELWSRLRPQLVAAPVPVRVPLRPTRRWAIAAAIAACLMAAFMLGRYWPRPDLQTAAAPGNIRERILLVAIGDHLERSQTMLVDLVNSQGNGTVDMTAERERAQELVAGNRLYRQTAARDGDMAMANILDQLERTLLEIAHSPSEMSAQRFEELRNSIEKQGIILKVRLVGARARESERSTASEKFEQSI